MAWHALRGAQSRFAQWSDDGVAARYDRAVSPFWAVETGSESDWAALEQMSQGRAVVLLGELSAPPGWSKLFGEALTQYIASTPDTAPELDVVTLAIDDVADMVELTKLTEPGPFLDRTHEMGHYIGVRDGGSLVAMAGERMQTEDFSEISAVCVHPDARRRGLAAALTLKLVHEIAARGQRAMLHVRDGNDSAHRLYRKIGFDVRAEVHVGAWRYTG